MHELSDSELMTRFRNVETRESAFTQILEKYQQRIYYQVRRMLLDHDDTNDVVQNVFIKVWNGLNHFREDSQLSTWLYRIAANESITFLKNKKRRGHVSMDEYGMQPGNAQQHDPLFTGDQLQRKLQKAISTLPEKQRLVFNLKYFENMKYEEMSKVLNTSEGALKASYHHAVKKIESFFTGD